MSVQPPPSAPGWYDGPGRPGERRWWDGTGWTDHVAPPPVADAFPGPGRPGPDRAARPGAALVAVVLAVVTALGAGAWWALRGRSGPAEDAHDRQARMGWQACQDAEAARRLSGDTVYAGVAPPSPVWPDWQHTQIKVYDTGVWRYRAVVSGVALTCLYDARHGTPARVGWGE